MGIVSRFAPSPTGALHLGHAWSAVRAHDLARAAGGRFLLRIEDIDPGRSRETFVEAIVEDLAWLGLSWDGQVVRQSERLDLYGAALDRLRAMGLLYPCFCTRADIAASLAAPHADGPVYPGTCRTIDPNLAADRRERQPHAWRIDMTRAAALAGPLAWNDAFAGRIVARPEQQGDVVIARKDAPASYHLAVTVDDADQDITDIVRGKDLFRATDIHRLLQALLDLPIPLYHHHDLLTDQHGRRLAKRDGAQSLSYLRERGVEAGTILAAIRAGDAARLLRASIWQNDPSGVQGNIGSMAKAPWPYAGR